MSSKRIIQRSPENLTVTISMDRELHDRLHARAKSLRLSKSALVRLMIAADLDGRSALQPAPTPPAVYPHAAAQPPAQFNEAGHAPQP